MSGGISDAVEDIYRLRAMDVVVEVDGDGEEVAVNDGCALDDEWLNHFPPEQRHAREPVGAMTEGVRRSQASLYTMPLNAAFLAVTSS